MPAVRKPTSILEATGALVANPHRVRKGEPHTGRGIGPPGPHLTSGQAGCWDEVVSACADGVFQSSDRPFLEELACLLDESRRVRAWVPKEGAADTGWRPQFGSLKISLLLTMFARCGMTPSDRSRVFVAPGGKDGDQKTGLAYFKK